MTTEAEAGDAATAREHGSLQELEDAGRTLPQSRQRERGRVTPWSQTRAGGTIEDLLFVVLSCLVRGHLLRPPQETPTLCPPARPSLAPHTADPAQAGSIDRGPTLRP